MFVQVYLNNASLNTIEILLSDHAINQDQFVTESNTLEARLDLGHINIFMDYLSINAPLSNKIYIKEKVCYTHPFKSNK